MTPVLSRADIQTLVIAASAQLNGPKQGGCDQDRRSPLGITRACCALLLLMATLSHAQSAKRALGAADLERLLRAGVTPTRAGVLVDERGVSFAVTPAVEAQLRAAGADDDLVVAIERAARAKGRLPAEKPKARQAADSSKGRETGGNTSQDQKVTALVIRSNVSGDRAFIDGVEVGPSSSRPRPVTPGTHTVELRKDGVASETKLVEVPEGQTATVRFTLPKPSPKPVEARVAAPSADAEASARDGMVAVPGGPFFMGCDETFDSECSDDEKPGKMVDVASFRIDKTEVTVADFARCVSAGVCSPPGDDGKYCSWPDLANHPVNCVSWEQAVAYCGWAGKRLPSDAEWEKAARGTDRRKYPWGDSGFGAGAKLANIEGDGDGFVGPAPVASFPAGSSPSGAVDMIGNVWEWTADPLGGRPAVRGGAWNYGPAYGRISARIFGTSTRQYQHVGFRCAQ